MDVVDPSSVFSSVLGSAAAFRYKVHAYHAVPI